jgi:hypothetical protein
MHLIHCFAMIDTTHSNSLEIIVSVQATGTRMFGISNFDVRMILRTPYFMLFDRDANDQTGIATTQEMLPSSIPRRLP